MALTLAFALNAGVGAAGDETPGIAALHEKQLCRFAWNVMKVPLL